MTKWKMTKLGDIAEVVRGSTITRKEVTPGKVPVIAGGQTPSCYHNSFNREGITITVSASGAYAGFVQYFEIPIFASDCSTIKVKDESEMSPKFLFYMLQASQRDIYSFQRGSGQPHVYPSQLVGLDIPVPSIDEQHKIVEILEGHLSRLDAALADVKQARIKAAQFRKSLLNSVYYNSEFTSVSLGTCIELIMGQAPPKETCNKDGEGTPFVKVGEFSKLYPTIEEWTLKPLRVAKTGDVLICVVGATVGKINLGIDCAIGRSVAAIRPKNTLLQKYLFYFLELKMLEIRGQSKGSAQGVITRDYINSIQIPLPELSVQQETLDVLESNFSQLEKSIEVSNSVERESLSLRRSLLQAAFTGQLIKEVSSV